MARQAGMMLAAENSGDLAGVFNLGSDDLNAEAVRTAIEGTMGGYVKTCSGCADTAANCFPYHLTLGAGTPYSPCTGIVGYRGNSAVLKSGMSINISNPSSFCTEDSDGTCCWRQVDINGMKSPNVIGRDMFYLTINRNGLARPYGWNQTDATILSDCNPSGNTLGSLCSAWYLRQ